MHTSYVMVGILLWIILALWPAFMAKRKGYSFILFFILAIFISWLLALIVALVLHDKNETPETRAADKAAERALAKEEDQ